MPCSPGWASHRVYRLHQCNHFDFSLFEAAYQEAKQARNSQLDPNSSGLYSVAPPDESPSGCSLLFGVSGGQNFPNHPLQGFRGGRGGANTDLEQLLEQTDGQRTSDPCSQASIYGASSTPVNTLRTLNPPAARTARRSTAPILLVGANDPVDSESRHCMWGKHQSTVVLAGGLVPCNERFSSPEDLRNHFSSLHTTFHEEWKDWVCTLCGLQQEPPSHPCFLFGVDAPVLGRYWARAGNAWASVDGGFGRVPSEDGASHHFFPASQSAQSFSPPGSHIGSIDTSVWSSGNATSVGLYLQAAARATKAGPISGSPPQQPGPGASASCQLAIGPDDDGWLLARKLPSPPSSSSSSPHRSPGHFDSIIMTSALLCRAPVALFDLVEAVSMTAAAAAAAFALDEVRSRSSAAAAGCLPVLLVLLVLPFLPLPFLTPDPAAQSPKLCAAAAAAADNDGFPAGDGVMDLAVACIVAGLVASWLFWRVRGRLGRVDPGATAARGSRVW